METNFELGKVVVTRGIEDMIEDDRRFARFVHQSLKRYMDCDWGDTCEEDKQSNNDALKNDERILAVYTWQESVKIWIITEWDRSVTTVLFPDEY